ncbi:MAG: type IV pilus assembly protein PilM [Candidatus Methylomirabilales bacterium]
MGVDIGTSSVKVVQLKHSGKRHELVQLGIAPLPQEVIVDGAIMDGGAVVSGLQQIFDEHKIGLRDVAVAVSGHSVIIKPIKMPLMKPEELAESIQWEAEQHIPFAIEDVNLDYQILQSPPGAVEMDILLVAVKKDIVNQYLTVASSAGLNVAVVDVDAFAVANAYEAAYEVDPQEVIALLHVGAAVTTLSIVQGGVPLFTRDSAIGGNRYNEAIQKMLGLSYEQAETLKLGGQVEGYSGADGQTAVDLVNTELVGDIRRSIDFFRASSPTGIIHRMLVSGGVARLPNFTQHLGEALELPVEIANPLRNVGADPKQFDPEFLEYVAPQLCIGVGLALRQVGD